LAHELLRREERLVECQQCEKISCREEVTESMLFTRSLLKSGVVLSLLLILPVMTTLAAESHVVPLRDLHRDAAGATQTRESNLAKAERFFSSEAAQKALRTVKLDGDQVLKAVPLLSDEELARLAARVDAAQADLAGGALSNEHLTYIVIALGTAVLILVIVWAR
jgi:hypothetical protein